MAIKRKVNYSRPIYTKRPSRAPHKRARGLDFGIIGLVIRGVIVVTVLFALWRVFAISQIEIKGNNAIHTAELGKVVEQSFKQHAFSKNLLTLSLAPLENDLLSDQRIGGVELIRLWPNRLEIRITERQLRLGWKSGEKLYWVDSKGVAIAEVASGGLRLPIVTDSTGLPVRVGGRVAPQSFVVFASRVAEELKSRTGLEIGDMSIPDTTSELDVKTKAGYVIKFDTGARVEDQLASLRTVLATLSRLQKKPIQYIDLRVPGKAYYL
jgi:cell division septal protein FtsQ